MSAVWWSRPTNNWFEFGKFNKAIKTLILYVVKIKKDIFQNQSDFFYCIKILIMY